MTINNHSVTADEYVINTHLTAKIQTAYAWKEGDIERLLNHLSLERKRECLREINKKKETNEHKEYLQSLKIELEREIKKII